MNIYELGLSWLIFIAFLHGLFCVCFSQISELWFRHISPWHPKVFDFAGSAPIHKSNLARDAMGDQWRSEQDSIRVIRVISHKRKQDETRWNKGKQRNSRNSQLYNLKRAELCWPHHAWIITLHSSVQGIGGHLIQVPRLLQTHCARTILFPRISGFRFTVLRALRLPQDTICVLHAHVGSLQSCAVSKLWRVGCMLLSPIWSSSHLCRHLQLPKMLWPSLGFHALFCLEPLWNFHDFDHLDLVKHGQIWPAWHIQR